MNEVQFFRDRKGTDILLSVTTPWHLKDGNWLRLRCGLRAETVTFRRRPSGSRELPLRPSAEVLALDLVSRFSFLAGDWLSLGPYEEYAANNLRVAASTGVVTVETDASMVFSVQPLLESSTAKEDGDFALTPTGDLRLAEGGRINLEALRTRAMNAGNRSLLGHVPSPDEVGAIERLVHHEITRDGYFPSAEVIGAVDYKTPGVRSVNLTLVIPTVDGPEVVETFLGPDATFEIVR